MFIILLLVRKGVIRMCNLCNKAACLVAGIMIGVLIGYENEDMIDDVSHMAKKEKRKLERKITQLRHEYDV